MENFNLKYQEKEGSKLKLGSQYRNYWEKITIVETSDKTGPKVFKLNIQRKWH